MKIDAEVRFRGRCKHCGEWFNIDRSFSNHMAYEHDIYHSKWYKFKATIRNKYLKLKKK